MTAPTEMTSASDAPDWEAIDRDVACPLCDYNLRGLPEPRCPECGYRFEWDELLRPQTQSQEYLFEARPERNAWSFFRTIVSTLRPGLFWANVSPTQRPNARRLVIYWLIAAAPAIAAVVVHTSLVDVRGTPLLETVSDLGIELQTGYSWHDSSVQHALVALLLLVCLAWPWLTVLALLVFQQSMAQARINRVHVLRCVVYSGDVILWLGMAAFVMLLNVLRLGGGGSGDEWVSWFYLAVSGGVAWMSARLTIAYRRYLRFDRPAATVLATQAIVIISMLAVLMTLAFQI